MHLDARPADRVLIIRASSVLRATSHFACRPATRRLLTIPKSPAIFRPVQKSRTKQIVLHVAADRVSTDTIEISLDYYRVLKARRVNSTEVLPVTLFLTLRLLAAEEKLREPTQTSPGQRVLQGHAQFPEDPPQQSGGDYARLG